MPNSGHQGQPEAGRELDLSQETPKPSSYDPPLDRIFFSANAGLDGLGGGAGFWVKGDILPVAELLVLCVSTCLVAVVVWGICHLEQLDSWISLVVSGGVSLAWFLTGRRYLMSRSIPPRQ